MFFLIKIKYNLIGDTMYDIKITVKKIVNNKELSLEFENEDFLNDPINLCPMKEGMTFISKNGEKPRGFCDSAWYDLKPYIEKLSNGIFNLYDGWMKDPKSAMVACSDGFRPVIFYLEVI